MPADLTDDVIWSCLTGPHARFSAGGPRARRYARGFSPSIRPGRGVADRDVVVAVHLRAFGPSAPRAASHISSSTPWVPVFSTSSWMLSTAWPRRVVRQAFHELQVEVLVDEAGALAVELVRQAAGADHHARARPSPRKLATARPMASPSL
jgi:hypothetical protein